jgi:hypothetical protein
MLTKHAEKLSLNLGIQMSLIGLVLVSAKTTFVANFPQFPAKKILGKELRTKGSAFRKGKVLYKIKKNDL